MSGKCIVRRDPVDGDVYQSSDQIQRTGRVCVSGMFTATVSRFPCMDPTCRDAGDCVYPESLFCGAAGCDSFPRCTVIDSTDLFYCSIGAGVYASGSSSIDCKYELYQSSYIDFEDKCCTVFGIYLYFFLLVICTESVPAGLISYALCSDNSAGAGAGRKVEERLYMKSAI